MKKSLLLGGMVAVVLVPSTVSAHAVNFTSPANGSKVGQQFTLVVQYDQDCNGGPVTVEPKAGTAQDYGILPAEPIVKGNQTTYNVDLTKPLRFDGSPNAQVYAKSGLTNFVIGVPDTECYAMVTLDTTPVQQAPAKAAPVAAQATATPTLSPSPTVAPVATPAAETKSDESIDPLVALILGVLLGAAILALAEVSAVEYRKKHGLKGDITKRK